MSDFTIQQNQLLDLIYQPPLQLRLCGMHAENDPLGGANRSLLQCDLDIDQNTGDYAMSTPIIAQKSPYSVAVESGKTYFWCACGMSAKQPFCDGTHMPTEFAPVKWKASESKTVHFCGCKHSTKFPLCDGSHQSL